jgi:hypothetical protein
MKTKVLILALTGIVLASGLVPGHAQNTNFFLAGTLTNAGTGNVIAIVAADVNGDGKPDLVLGGTNLLTIYTNNGVGWFSLAGTVPFPGGNLSALAAANIRGIGRMDLIAANNSPTTVTIFTNTGSGGFGSNATYAISGSAYGGITAVDVNGDGSLDLVVATYNITAGPPDFVTVLTNNGSGVFATSWIGNAPGFFYSHSAAVADFNGDGKPDIAISLYTYGEVGLFTNIGGGQFAQSQVVSLGGSSVNCVAADFAGVTGFAGLAVSDSLESDGITVLTNNGKGQLAVQATYGAGQNFGGLLAADIIGNGKIDILGASESSNIVVLLTNNGAGIFSQEPPLSSGLTESGGNGGSLVVTNFNAGGTPDIAVVAAGTNIVSIYFSMPASQQATAVAVVDNDFVVSARVIYGGAGYTSPPPVLIIGGGGSGATATATVSNGIVTAITVLNAGSGYTNLPNVIIAPPGGPGATATASIIDGFVVGATITFSGFGYTNPPAVYIIGGGGSGAVATATVSNGMVVSINFGSAGSDYTSVPTIVIAPPVVTVPQLNIAFAQSLNFTNLLTGTTYQFQTSPDSLTWANADAPFVAAATSNSQYVNLSSGNIFYRLIALPASATAGATAVTDNGFVTGAIVTNNGSGYASPPIVTITGGGGSGATATATVSNGMVVAVIITSAGSNYTNGIPVIVIASPPIPSLTPAIAQAIRLDFNNLTPNLEYQLQSAVTLESWTNYGAALDASGTSNSQYLNLGTGSSFYRLLYVP